MAENYILAYWEKIQSGEVVVSKRVRQQYQKLVVELENPRDPWVFDLEAANAPIEFIERFCRHSKGKWIGQPVRLELWQKAMLVSLSTPTSRGLKVILFKGGLCKCLPRFCKEDSILNSLASFYKGGKGRSMVDGIRQSRIRRRGR